MGKEEGLRRVVPWSREVADRARQAYWPTLLNVRDARDAFFLRSFVLCCQFFRVFRFSRYC